MLARPLGLLALSAALFFLPAAARPDGLIYQLPKDGAWVRFDYESETRDDKGAFESAFTGTVRLSSVGTEKVDGERCRWIELKTHIVSEGNPDYTELFKLLLPEKQLGEGHDALAQVVRGWYKYGGVKSQQTGKPLDYAAEKPNKIKTHNIRRMSPVLSRQLDLPWKETQQLEDQVVESRLGKLSCRGIATRSSGSLPGQGKLGYVVNLERRLHKDAPFGLVYEHRDYEATVDGKLKSRTIQTLRLADIGTDAKSEIPESK